MESKNDKIKNIFNNLSENNKDILILVAKTIKVTQETVDKRIENRSA